MPKTLKFMQIGHNSAFLVMPPAPPKERRGAFFCTSILGVSPKGAFMRRVGKASSLHFVERAKIFPFPKKFFSISPQNGDNFLGKLYENAQKYDIMGSWDIPRKKRNACAARWPSRSVLLSSSSLS